MSRRDVQVHVFEHRLTLDVVEADALEPHVAADRLDLLAVRAVGHLRLHVHQLEDPRSGDHGALKRPILHCEVQHRLEEALYVEGEGYQHAHFDGVI